MEKSKTTTALLPFGIQPPSAWRVSVDLTPQLARRLRIKVYLVSKFWSENSMVESVRFDMTDEERDAVVALAADERLAMPYEERIDAIDEPIIVSSRHYLPFVRPLGAQGEVYLAWSVSRNYVAIEYMNHAEELAFYTINPIPWSLLQAVERGLDVKPGAWID